MCPQLSSPSNGRVVYYTLDTDFPPFELTSTATYECTSGYGLTPSGVDPVRMCQSDTDSLNGVWTGQALACSGISTYNFKSHSDACHLYRNLRLFLMKLS